jgi:hypothetical protein
MKPRYWKYYCILNGDSEVKVYRHIVEGNNVNHLKPLKGANRQAKELVTVITVKVPMETFEAFKEMFDSSGLQTDDRFFTASFGLHKRPIAMEWEKIKSEILQKFPLTPILTS